MPYWEKKGWQQILNGHVARMNKRFPKPPSDARFFLRVSKVPLKDYPFRVIYEDEDDEDEPEENSARSDKDD